MQTVQITKAMQEEINTITHDACKTPWVVYANDYAVIIAESRGEARSLKSKDQKIAKASELNLVVEMTSIPGMVEPVIQDRDYAAHEYEVNPPAPCAIVQYVDDGSGNPRAVTTIIADVVNHALQGSPEAAQALADVGITAVAKPKSPKIPMVRESSIERPCKQVWHIADAMKAEILAKLQAAHAHKTNETETVNTPEPTDKDALAMLRRKDVLARCVASGIAFYTARTQYQLWLTIQNGGSI